MKKFLLAAVLGIGMISSGNTQFYMDAGYAFSGIKLHAANRSVFLYNFTRRDWLEKNMPFMTMMHGFRLGAGYELERGFFHLEMYLSWNTYTAEGIPPSTMTFGGRNIRLRHHYFKGGGGIFIVNREKFALAVKGTLDLGNFSVKTRTYDSQAKADWVQVTDDFQLAFSLGIPLEFRMTRWCSFVLEPFVQFPLFDADMFFLQNEINGNLTEVGRDTPLNGGIQGIFKLRFPKKNG